MYRQQSKPNERQTMTDYTKWFLNEFGSKGYSIKILNNGQWVICEITKGEEYFSNTVARSIFNMETFQNICRLMIDKLERKK